MLSRFFRILHKIFIRKKVKIKAIFQVWQYNIRSSYSIIFKASILIAFNTVLVKFDLGNAMIIIVKD